MANGPEPGMLVWSELQTRDAATAADFYTRLFGWTMQDYPMPDGSSYIVMLSGGRPSVGIRGMSGPQFDGVPAHWLSYIEVGNVDAAADEAARLGGRVLAPPFDVEGVGRIAVIQDQEGAVLALMTSRMSAP